MPQPQHLLLHPSYHQQALASELLNADSHISKHGRQLDEYYKYQDDIVPNQHHVMTKLLLGVGGIMLIFTVLVSLYLYYKNVQNYRKSHPQDECSSNAKAALVCLTQSFDSKSVPENEEDSAQSSQIQMPSISLSSPTDEERGTTTTYHKM